MPKPTTRGAPDTPLQRYVALRQAGDAQGALAAAREACAAAPDVPASHYALGEILAALDDNPGAAAAFIEALRRAPGWADAWVNLGLARYRQGAVHAAKAAMREALRAAPFHAAAAGNLGALMRITGEAESAEALLREALARAPDNEAARLNLAAELLHREQGAEALVLLDAAPALPSSPAALRQWQLARIMALLQRGPAVAARQAMDDFAALGPVPPALAPLWHWRRVLLAQLQRNEAAADSAASDMAAAVLAMGPDAVPEHRIMAHYDLAKFCSSRRNVTAAFAHWQEGHSLLRLSQPFSRGAFAAFIEANISAFDAARFQNRPRAANRDSAPVFIVGMPRSGTSLCEQILAAHPAVHGAGERAALGQMAVRLGGWPPSMARHLMWRGRTIWPRCTRWRRIKPASSIKCPATSCISAWWG
jgi:Tfp pilus assembly protein PilF